MKTLSLIFMLLIFTAAFLVAGPVLLALSAPLLALGATAIVTIGVVGLLLAVLSIAGIVVIFALKISLLIIAAALIAVAILGLTGQVSAGIQGNGEITEQLREIKAFTGIRIEGTCTLTAECGSEPSVSVRTDSNLQSLVTVEVVDQTLVVHTAGKIRPSKGIDIRVHCGILEMVAVAGAAKAVISGIDSRNFALTVSGAGDINAAGACSDLSIEVDGAARVDLSGLHAMNARIRLSGASKAVLNVSAGIDAEVDGVGIITVHGHPAKITKKISGLGKINVL
ncbi:MAG: DUF2807 domain-containing protein [Candidatus Wallbacteria bacterium]|nr:DUF2807 domain-containing protein [Candidatus Wallbacteria bacterium]